MDGAAKKGQLDAVAKDAQLITNASKARHPLAKIFTDRTLNFTQKTKKINKVIKAFSPLTQRLFAALLKHKPAKLYLIPKVMARYLLLLDQHKAKYVATITTPQKISEAERNQYIQLAKKEVKNDKATINVIEKVDDRLASGFTVYVGNRYVSKAKIRPDPNQKQKILKRKLDEIKDVVKRDLRGPKVNAQQWSSAFWKSHTDKLLQVLEGQH